MELDLKTKTGPHFYEWGPYLLVRLLNDSEGVNSESAYLEFQPLPLKDVV